MKVLVLSDIHDHVDNLRQVISETKGKVEAVIFCGDMCAPFTAAVLGEIGLPVYACLGNNDEDHIAMLSKAGEMVKFVGLGVEYSEIDLDERKIVFNHYPKLGELLAQSGDYDASFHGHTHEILVKEYDHCISVNPGAVCGIQGMGYGVASYGIYDSKKNKVEIVRFGNGS